MEQAWRSRCAVDAVRVTNRAGRSPFVLVCDHASNFVPAAFRHARPRAASTCAPHRLGSRRLPVARAWPGRSTRRWSNPCVSRLVIDCNRPLDAPDLIPAVSETTVIPGNAQSRQPSGRRASRSLMRPFHDAIEAVVERRLARRAGDLAGLGPFLHAGLQGRAAALADRHHPRRRPAPRRAADRGAEAPQGVTVGVNQPYSPADRVYFTLDAMRARAACPAP